jgi:membrane protein implicated in regulation of membrane protease activity
MDLLNTIFLGCFIFGLVFTVASFLLGGLGHLGGADGLAGGHGGHIGEIGHGHVGGAHLAHAGHGAEIGHDTAAAHGHPGIAHEHGHGQTEAGGLNWLNFSALIVFITWFGGAGFVLSSLGAEAWLAIPLALVGGVIGYFAILFFFSKILYGSQTPFMKNEDYNLTGTVARVSSPIFEQGMGEIIYTKFGTRRSAPARSLAGRPFAKEAQVVILRYENGVAYVEDLDTMLAEAGAEKWSLKSEIRNQKSEVNDEV